MPRLINKTPSYREHKASGQAVVGIDGVDVYLGTHGTAVSKREYDRVIGEWLANGRKSVATADLTITEVISRFWAHIKVYAAPRPGSTNTGEIDCHKSTLKILKRLYGPTHARDFSPLAMVAVRNDMITAGWSRTHINAQVRRIRRMFKWAVAQELVPASVFHGLQAVDGLREGKTAAVESEPVRPVTAEQVAAVLPLVPPQVRAIIELQQLTGARPGEICTMRAVDFDKSDPALWVYRPERHKTQHKGHERTIFLGERCQAILQPFLKREPTEHLFNPAEAARAVRERRTAARKTPASCGNVVGSNRARRPKKAAGDCYTVDVYRRAIARACDRAFPAPAALLEDTPAAKAALSKWKSDHR